MVNLDAMQQVITELNQNTRANIRQSKEVDVRLSESARRLLDDYNPDETEFLNRFIIRPQPKGIDYLEVFDP